MWRVLAALASNGEQRQIDLADLTSIEASTLSRLVTRLVRMGLVTRTRSANSNREVAVELSAKGTALVARLIPIARAYEKAAIAGLSREETLVLKRCLRRDLWQYEEPERYFDGAGSLSNAVSRSALTGASLKSGAPAY